MSTEKEKYEAIRCAVKIARKRLDELDNRGSLSKVEIYEREQTVDCIKRGLNLLGIDYDPSPWCSYGHKTEKECDCGPIAEND